MTSYCVQDFCRALVPPMSLPNMALTEPLAAFLRSRSGKDASTSGQSSPAKGKEHETLLDAVCFFPQAIVALTSRCAASLSHPCNQLLSYDCTSR